MSGTEANHTHELLGFPDLIACGDPTFKFRTLIGQAGTADTGGVMGMWRGWGNHRIYGKIKEHESTGKPKD